jgi:hypothetical protein
LYTFGHATVGEKVGPTVGLLVGDGVGNCVGDEVGNDVVGFLVGDAVARQNVSSNSPYPLSQPEAQIFIRALNDCPLLCVKVCTPPQAFFVP